MVRGFGYKKDGSEKHPEAIANKYTLKCMINNQPWTLPLFFIIPRSLICLSVTLSCMTVSSILRNNIKYAQEMEKIAEIDEMMYENKRRFHKKEEHN